MKRHLKYLSYVLRHKWYVFLACRELSVPLLGALLHDWDKFLPEMWFSYAVTFYKKDGTSRYLPISAFEHAWNGHEKRNKHHWQYWILIKDSGDQIPLRIPERHLREMLADWIGAGRALGKPDTAAWYVRNRENITMHPDSRRWIEEQLGVVTPQLPLWGKETPAGDNELFSEEDYEKLLRYTQRAAEIFLTGEFPAQEKGHETLSSD